MGSYLFNGHIRNFYSSDKDVFTQEVKDGIFLMREPSRLMQRIVETNGAECNVVMGHYLLDKEVEDKNKWLDMHFSSIKDRIFKSVGIDKWAAIKVWLEDNGYKQEDAILIDDTVSILFDAEKHGIKAYHISSLLDWDYR